MISGIAYFSVSDLLNDQAGRRMHQTCYAKGSEIISNLLLMETELKMVISQAVNMAGLSGYPTIFSHFLQYQDTVGRFISLAVLAQNGQIISTANNGIKAPVLTSEQRNHLNLGRTLIYIRQNPQAGFDIFLARLMDPGRLAAGMVLAQANPEHIWGREIAESLSYNMEIAVLSSDGEVMVSSFTDFNLDRIYLEEQANTAISGSFESVHKGEAHIATYRKLFMKHRFHTSGWIIILAQSKSSIMEPVKVFKKLFFLLILLVFLVVSYLSVSLIRKSLVPIEILRQGTLKIADGQFGYTLDIKSGDEFENLGEAFNDMSKRLKEGRALLVQAAKMGTIGQMAAGVVHEIGQPLNSIFGFVDLLGMHPLTPKQQKYLDVIRKELVRLNEIIRKFRSFSRTADEKMDPLSVNQLIDDTYNLMSHQVKNKGIRFVISKGEKLPPIRGDKNSLEQVFINLTINAVHALEEKKDAEPMITIATRIKDGCVCVDVKDNGSGIAKEIQSHIFDPFFTTKSEEKGTGLGLAIIDSILHKHQAKIELNSEIGVGTRFRIIFPAAVARSQTKNKRSI
jgi:signal transduction histidine kinase